jgi:hypothetical protein
MRLIILCGLSILLGIGFRFNPSRVLIVIICLLVAVPAPATALLTGKDYAVSGGGLSLLPTTVTVGGCVVVALLSRRVLSQIRFPLLQTMGLYMVLSGTIVTTLSRGSGSGMGQVLDSLVGPMALFSLILIANTLTPQGTQMVRSGIVVIGAIEGILGIAQYALKRPILFEQDYARQVWFKFISPTTFRPMDTFFRSMGTFDHPLTYALFMLLVLCMVLTLPNPTLAIVLSVLSILAIAASGSRAALFGALIVIVIFAFARDLKAKLIVLSGCLGAALLLTVSPLGEALAARSSDDGGSFEARRLAVDLFVQILPGRLFWGSGLGSSDLVAAHYSLQTSFESPLLILSIEIGLTLAVLLIVIMISFALGLGSGSVSGPYGYAILVVLAVSMTYSSFGVKSEAGYVVWIALALAMTRPHLNQSASLGERRESAVRHNEAYGLHQLPVKDRSEAKGRPI